jgi:hypothetical protein
MREELIADGRVDMNIPVRISTLWTLDLFRLWEKYGTGCMMEFDVSSDESWSMKLLSDVVMKENKI